MKRRVNYKGKGAEITHLASSFNAMASQTEALIHEMKDVTNNIAHDLRTPVTRMRGIAENSLDSNLPEVIELSAKVIEECERQATIIEDILSLAESESGVIELNKQQVKVNDILEDLVDLYSPIAEDRNCHLVFEGEHEVIAEIDRNRFQRAIANLVDNAIKYSEGKISVELSDHSGAFIVRVKDQGPGIPQELRSEVFKRFVRGDSSRNTEGSGLGLSLAKAYIQNHGGKIQLEDSESGAFFLITMPL